MDFSIFDKYENRIPIKEFISGELKYSTEFSKKFYDSANANILEKTISNAIETLNSNEISTLFIKEPLFFNNNILKNPTSYIISCVPEKFQKEAKNILKKSKNNIEKENDIYFRCYFDGKTATIAGSLTSKIKNIRGISHELGHALYFSQTNAICDAASEAWAYLFEDLVLEPLLTNDEKINWNNYKKNSMAIHSFWFLWEISRLPKYAYLKEHLKIKIKSSWTLSRETLYTSPGYQMQYVYADLILKKLGIDLLNS